MYNISPLTSLFLLWIMHRVLVTCVWIVVAVTAIRLRAEDQAQQKEVPTYSLSGTVVNSVTGEPGRRALVQIPMESTLTDDSGRFSFDGEPGGDYFANVRKPGFNPDHTSTGVAEVARDSQPLILKLIPCATITGTITDSDGLPVVNLPVRVLRKRRSRGTTEWETAAVNTTDEDGYFRVSQLPPGTYYVAVGPSHHSVISANSTPGERVMYPQIFYAGSRDLSSATPIKVAAGAMVELDFAVRAERSFGVYPETGAFEAEPVPAGSYILTARTMTGPDQQLIAERARRACGRRRDDRAGAVRRWPQ